METPNLAMDPPDILSRLPRWLAWYLSYGLGGKNTRQRRRLFALNIISIFAVITSLTYAAVYFLFDSSLWPGAIGATSNAIIFGSLPFIYRKHEIFGFFVGAILSCISFLLLTYLMGIGSGIHLLMFVAPAAVLVIFGPLRWHLLLASLLVSTLTVSLAVVLIGDPALPAANDPVLQTGLMLVSTTSALWLVIIPGYVGFLRAERAEDALEAEHARSEALLYNLLPTEIATRLKEAPGKTIADNLDHTAILFADIVGFTPRSARMTPEELVKFLNRIFSTFDMLAEKHGLEKIKTIGDAYMVAAGLPQPVDQPVQRVAEMAFDMLTAMQDFSDEIGDTVEVRIGIHAGPVVAGVIGHQKLFYDVWGDTVNTASRMESHGEPGRIQVTAAARDALMGDYAFTPRGLVEIKGIGALETWWLKAARKTD
ncbi:adenylate/guanylate cyclase domain-containing protein [Shimia aestuarii]|nr:adenylate/guanylate cyclase domain-containing protein [Shimia aestuarii]